MIFLLGFHNLCRKGVLSGGCANWAKPLGLNLRSAIFVLVFDAFSFCPHLLNVLDDLVLVDHVFEIFRQSDLHSSRQSFEVCDEIFEV